MQPRKSLHLTFCRSHKKKKKLNSHGHPLIPKYVANHNLQKLEPIVSLTVTTLPSPKKHTHVSKIRVLTFNRGKKKMSPPVWSGS